MAERFDDWESYFYPPPDDRTLRNQFDEHDPHVLSRIEYAESAQRERQLTSGAVDLARTFDARHLCAIHRHLFQDVYAWAGEYRTVNIAKGPGGGFADVGSDQIDRYLGDVHQLIAETDWVTIGQETFAVRMADVFAYLNQAHPFREGNGRAAKVFLQHVAELSPFDLDYTRISPEAWNQASMLSGPDVGAHEPVPDSLVPVFRAIAVPRET